MLMGKEKWGESVCKVSHRKVGKTITHLKFLRIKRYEKYNLFPSVPAGPRTGHGR